MNSDGDPTDVYSSAIGETRTLVERRDVMTATEENFLSLAKRFGATIRTDGDGFLIAGLNGSNVRPGDEFVVFHGLADLRFEVVDRVASNFEGWSRK